VDAAESLDREVGQGLDGRMVGDVDVCADGALLARSGVQLGGELLSRRQVEVADDDLSTCLDEAPHDLLAETGGGTGDDDASPCQRDEIGVRRVRVVGVHEFSWFCRVACWGVVIGYFARSRAMSMIMSSWPPTSFRCPTSVRMSRTSIP
jgi:hypothetical protein